MSNVQRRSRCVSEGRSSCSDLDRAVDSWESRKASIDAAIERTKQRLAEMEQRDRFDAFPRRRDGRMAFTVIKGGAE
jgi:hypothetical protein